MRPIYLCGPIQGRSETECSQWRETATGLLAPIPTLNPLRRGFYGKDHDNVKIIVEGDLDDVMRSSCILAMFDVPSVGTSMEIFCAHTASIPVYTVDISCKPRSPWLIYHTTQFFNNLINACAFIRTTYGISR